MSDRITSPQDLMKLREQAKAQVELRGGPKETRVVVHMGTCGIAAGARDVVAELLSELDRKSVQTVTVRQSGCIGLCDQEPMLTFTDRTGRNFLYVHLTPEKVRELVAHHIINGKPLEKYIMEGDPK
jgi:NADP-reducing hydrogenase subunit HndB